MRVISGVAKGRRLRSTRAPTMRPTTDTARRTIFDILRGRIEGARVLDLFAGAGTLGIEALSRGAREAVFVERDRGACGVILHNLELTGFRDAAQIRRADVLRALTGDPGIPFDLVFVDPPYGRGLRFVTRVLDALVAGSWVRLGGTVVVEAEAGEMTWPVGLSEIRARRFGRTQVRVAERDAGRDDSYLSGDI